VIEAKVELPPLPPLEAEFMTAEPPPPTATE
jgi:hypothetical protein